MAAVIPKTVRESLYWSYANLAMAFASSKHGEPEYQQVDFIVRNKIYHGLLKGKLQLGSLLIDEREKLATANACCYCGSSEDLTLDHLLPQLKGGVHSSDNLVVACRSCNSSKGARDLMEWMSKRDTFPTLCLLRRYLKLVIRYCESHGLMEVGLPGLPKELQPTPTLFDAVDDSASGEALALGRCPFALQLLPHTFPEPDRLVARFSTEPEDDALEPF